MREKIHFGHESEYSPDIGHEHLQSPSETEQSPDTNMHAHQENINHIMGKIEKYATTQEEFNRQRQLEDKKLKQNRYVLADGQLKTTTLKRSLQKMQQELRPYQKPFSRFIHNNLVDSLSEACSNTLARPSGLLAGGIVSFIASMAILILCRYFGYEYNYLIGLISFPAGFMLGLIGESILRPLKKD